ncbi:MAG: SDR family oxidoreductase [Anaerolineae bacterium]|nr:SDR family oxidoreductase [Anaerolineae bacterium]MBL8105129.1 SDR family oxidoreductase [Anaerolineales bacterium]MCC7190946.1 SDR family oxidoreductase [Anaerolineales bacterium]
MEKLALVTGGAHRLGKSFVLTLARLGYDIVLHYHSAVEEAIQTQGMLESLNVRVTLAPADLTDPQQIQSLVSSLQSLNILVNSAAFMPSGNVESLSLETWDSTLDLNLRAPFLLAQECAKKMTDGGLIVNITDVGAQKAWSRYPSYTVSKAALESLTKILARALAPKIRVNAIAPGFVLQSDIVSADVWEKLISRVPLKRPARTEEVASALEFLVKNEYITGQTIVVDGGYSLV